MRDGLKLKQEGNDARNCGDLVLSQEKYVSAIKIFEVLFLESDLNKFNKCMILGTLYNRTDSELKALEMFKMATNLRPESELASLSVYLLYVDLDKSENAIDEFKRFLSDHPADLYKVTLGELLGELKEGRLPYYRDEILAIAIKNGVMV